MATNFDFNDRVALVTGGASGIGLGIATALLKRGAKVVIGDIRADHMQAAQARLAEHGERLAILRLDVTSASHWTQVRDEVKKRYGALHVLCLNAGIGILGTILQANSDDWDWIMGVNLRGVTLGIETFLPMICAQRAGGRICATSSMGGLVVADDGGIYSSAKYGVVALMECLRAELARERIGVSVLCPAGVNTNIHDHSAMRPREFAATGFEEDPEQRRVMQEMARKLLSKGADPLHVGERVVDAMASDQPYVFTDALVAPILNARREALLAAVH